MSSRLDIALTYPRQGAVGGAERYLDQLAAHLATAGHGVTIVCRRHAAPPHPDVRFERLNVRSVGGAWRAWAFARSVERYVATHRHDLVVGLGRTWSQDVLRFGGACRETYAAVQRRFGEGAGRWGRLLRERVALAIERRTFAPGAYRRILTNSELVKRDVTARYRVDRADVAVVHNGVDTDRFHPRHRADAGRRLRRTWGCADEDFILLFVGMAFARKGLGPLLDALPGLLRARPDVRLVVVGDDRRRSAYEARAERLGVADRVLFAGGRSDPEHCFAAADLHVLPTHYDSFAYTVLEAFASGLPVVTTANAGAAELVRDDVHGEVIPPDFDVGELERALASWCVRDRARAAAAEVRARAEEHSVERCMRAVTAEILSVADRRPASPAGRAD